MADTTHGLRAILEQHGALLTRRADGRLCDRAGQLYFDFSAEPESVPGAVRRPLTADECYRSGYAAEQAGQFKQALTGYRQALNLGGPDAEACYGLACVLYSLGRKEAAAERFRQTVEIDPGHAPGWNSLGIVLEELGELEDALAAYQTALQVAPRYDEVHCHLADLLERLDRNKEAEQHWRAYASRGTEAGWLRYAATRLRRAAD
ncbi:MAG: tetratricopeptide repeat protein [Gemmataceae bacterium]|nr:tetratricopeptide repeat protein [Gemmataceae bacterium]